MDQAKLEKLVNDSGFPLQLRIEEEVRGSQGSWSVESREHPWRENAFLARSGTDLVGFRCASFVSAIRVLCDPRHGRGAALTS